MANVPSHNVPEVKAERTSDQKRVFLTDKGQVFLPRGRSIDGALSRDPTNSTPDEDVLQAGLLMGKITASKLYAPSVIATIINAEIATATAIEVTAAQAAELVRRVGATGTFLLTGPPAAAGVVISEIVTYTNVNTTTGVITVAATTAAFIAGSFIQPEDGSETILTFIPDGSGIKVTDQDKQNQTSRYPMIPLAGVVDFSSLIPAPTDTSLVTYVKDALNAAGNGYSFDDTFE